ncbi:MAG TPA: FKBP-type peptidyl-prolyl cis-trans isomerase [Candidatus Saccharimonadales bacterium]|nr:FKBP-type peptidyl-prolyl cis-trans isomerase [Candidatus Saccharimonadales bacterium]
MYKNKYVIVPAVAIVTVAVASGAYLLLGESKANTPNYDVNPTSTLLSSNNSAQSPSSLNTANSDSSGGLSVSNSTSSDGLGEQGQTAGTSNSSTSPSSSAASSNNPVNPANFSQYDKYKTATNALFGEIHVGTGTQLTAGHKATVYYKGWLTNGSLFDETKTNTSGNPIPFSFTLGAHQVITGWEEGLAGMKAGGIRLVIVPPAVGYGSQANGPIPANSVLVFEVQLVSVQ